VAELLFKGRVCHPFRSGMCCRGCVVKDVCRRCELGKFTKAVFPSSDSMSTRILDLIHTDVCGPMSWASLTGCEYYLTFIDDHSKKTWIYFLEAKSEVFKRFQEFKSLVENQTGRRIKVLQSDSGGEYASIEFVNFCFHTGTRRQMIVSFPNRMGLSRGRTGRLQVQRDLCCMIRLCLYIDGLRRVLLHFICRTGVPIEFWGRRLLRSPSLVGGLMLSTSGFLDA
jgi:hypothetical protein